MRVRWQVQKSGRIALFRGRASYNVLEDPMLREGIKQFSNWPTVPQLYIDGEFVGGCDIALAMYESGELEKLVQGPAAAAQAH
jgi:monothiol glutaredoxin